MWTENVSVETWKFGNRYDQQINIIKMKTASSRSNWDYFPTIRITASQKFIPVHDII